MLTKLSCDKDHNAYSTLARMIDHSKELHLYATDTALYKAKKYYWLHFITFRPRYRKYLRINYNGICNLSRAVCRFLCVISRFLITLNHLRNININYYVNQRNLQNVKPLPLKCQAIHCLTSLHRVLLQVTDGRPPCREMLHFLAFIGHENFLLCFTDSDTCLYTEPDELRLPPHMHFLHDT